VLGGLLEGAVQVVRQRRVRLGVGSTVVAEGAVDGDGRGVDEALHAVRARGRGELGGASDVRAHRGDRIGCALLRAAAACQVDHRLDRARLVERAGDLGELADDDARRRRQDVRSLRVARRVPEGDDRAVAQGAHDREPDVAEGAGDEHGHRWPTLASGESALRLR
jgi:hypothetical protein